MTKLAEIYARRERTLKRRERRKAEKTVTLEWLDGEARVDWNKRPHLEWTGGYEQASAFRANEANGLGNGLGASVLSTVFG